MTMTKMRPAGRGLACVALAALVILLMGQAAAALAAHQPPAQPGADEFVPVTSLPMTDRLPAAPFVIGAYAFVWIALVGYLWSIWRRLNKVERDIEQLARRQAPATRTP
jgi:CcmD family protein